MNPTPHDDHGRNGSGHEPGSAVPASPEYSVSPTCGNTVSAALEYAGRADR